MLGKVKLTPEEAEKIKALYDPAPVFKYKDKTGRYEAVFTPISNELMGRIRELVKEETVKGNLLPVDEVNNKVFDECVVWPKVTKDDKMDLPSGLIPNIVKSIQEKSMFLDIDLYERPLRADEYTEVIKDFNFWPDIEDDELAVLKEKIPFQLFKTVIDRWVFILRPMTRADIAIVQAALDDQLALCKCVTVWPKEIPWDEIPAGIIEVLGRAITRLSGWTDEAEIEEL